MLGRPPQWWAAELVEYSKGWRGLRASTWLAKKITPAATVAVQERIVRVFCFVIAKPRLRRLKIQEVECCSD